MFSDIRHPDGSYEFRLHVPPDRLDPTTAAEALAVLRGLVRELEPFVEPAGVALRVLPTELSRVGRAPARLKAVGFGVTAAAAPGAEAGEGRATRPGECDREAVAAAPGE